MGWNRHRGAILAVWLLADAAVLVPGGVVSEVRAADRRIDANLRSSPYGRICFRCSNPAVKMAVYSDGATRYSCADHEAPDRMRSTSGATGEKRFKAGVCLGILGVVFGLNTLRAAIHAGKPAVFRPSVVGALLGLGFAVACWFWFRSL